MPHALVTGGAGLIGSHLVDLLVKEGWKVRILDNLEPVTHPGGRKPSWLNPEAEFRFDGLNTPSTLRGHLKGIDVVFHQAAYGGFDPNANLKMTQTNCDGTVRLLEACRDHPTVRKIVLASSQAVYGPGRYCAPEHWIGPGLRSRERLEAGDWHVYAPSGQLALPMKLKETDPLHPRGVYACSKHYAERVALVLGEEWDIPVVALRYALTYGPRQSLSNPYTGICSIFAGQLIHGEPLRVYEDGHQTRDFIYVTDVARANLLAANEGAAVGRVFNVGSGVAVHISAFVNALGFALGFREVPMPNYGNYRPLDARDVVTDPTALNALGWIPQVSLDDGLHRYARWYEEQE